MADGKISSRDAIAGSAVDVDNDLIELVDMSEAPIRRNKKITIAELVARTLSFLQSGTGASTRTVQGKLQDLEISIKDFGAVCDDSTDDTAAFQAAVDSLVASDNNLRSGAKIIIPGPTVITGTVTFTKRSIIIEGRGWGYREDSSNTRRSYVRWNGSAGSPMFKFVDCFGGSIVRDLNLKGKTTDKPSAAIEFNEGAASGVPNATLALDNVRIGSFAGETDAGTQFTDGILWSGTNNNSEHSLHRVYITGCSGYGIKQASIQNVNIKADHLTVANCGTGAYVTGHLQGSNWNFSANTVDFETPLQDNGSSTVNAFITCHNYYSELAGRMATFNGTARFVIYGGQFQLSASLNADGKVAQQAGNLGLYFKLQDFRFTTSGLVVSPYLSFRSAAAGESERAVVLDGITGWSNMTGGTNGLEVATRGPTDRTYVYFRETPQAASSTPHRVSQNFLHGLSREWDINAFQVRNNTALSLHDDFLGDVLTDEWGTQEGTDAATAIAVLAGQHGGALRLTTGANASADMAGNGVQVESYLNWKAEQGGLAIEGRLRNSNTTSVVIFFGFTDQVGSLEMPFTLGAGDALTSNATDAVGVLYDTAADTDNWWLVGVANNVDATKQDSGSTLASSSTWQTWRIEVTSAGAATFYLNGVQKGTAMTGAVTASVALTPVLATFRRGAASSTTDADYIHVECNRAL